MKLSRRCKDFEDRVKFLKNNILPDLRIDGNYNDLELDFIRSFILLIHAEIENFIEDRVLDKADSIYNHWMLKKKKSTVLKSMIIFSKVNFEQGGYKKTDKENISFRMSLIFRDFKENINRNHGIKRENLLNLLLPIGIEISELDESWLNTMNAFGETRGVIAHKSYAVRSSLDPGTIIYELENIIIPELRTIDQLITRLS